MDCTCSPTYKLGLYIKPKNRRYINNMGHIYIAQYFNQSITLARPGWIQGGLYMKPNILNTTGNICSPIYSALLPQLEKPKV